MDYEANRQAIKEQYGFDQWPRGRERPAGVGRLAAEGTESPPLPWLERTPLEGGDFIDAYGDGRETLVLVWIHERRTPLDAHEALVDYLATCMAPDLPTGPEKALGAGEVSFAGHDEPSTSLVFVRDHWLVRLHSVGDVPYPLGPMAEAVDGHLQTLSDTARRDGLG